MCVVYIHRTWERKCKFKKSHLTLPEIWTYYLHIQRASWRKRRRERQRSEKENYKWVFAFVDEEDTLREK